jgi:predicted nicotinamide N-methyase
VLVPFLKKCSIKLNQLRVLEIGCGWGLLGVHLAKMYCCKVTCSDYDAKVLPIVKEQAELNKVSIETKKLSFNELSSEYLDNFDLIIGSEVCYSDETSLAITQMIQRASLGNPKNILIADPGRPGFHDCYKVCSEYFSTKLTVLPGSINGKVTYLLTVAT